MLEKISTDAEIEKFLQIYNYEIKPFFDDYLDEDEKKNLSFFLEKSDLKKRKFFL